MSLEGLPPARRKAILDTVIGYLRDRPHHGSMYVTLNDIAGELPISEMAAAGAMTHLEKHGPYNVRRDDRNGEIRWMVSGMLS